MKNLILFENYHPGKEIEIRKATKKECEDFSDSSDTHGPAEANLNDMVHDGSNIFGAFEEGKMLGGVSFQPKKKIKDATEINLIFVDPKARNKGIGKHLIDYVSDNTNTKFIIANPYTDESQKFFEKYGFVLDEDFDENDPNTVVLERKKH